MLREASGLASTALRGSFIAPNLVRAARVAGCSGQRRLRHLLVFKSFSFLIDATLVWWASFRIEGQRSRITQSSKASGFSVMGEPFKRGIAMFYESSEQVTPSLLICRDAGDPGGDGGGEGSPKYAGLLCPPVYPADQVPQGELLQAVEV